MVYKLIDFNDAFIASFERLSEWQAYVKHNKHWNLTKEEVKELHKLCRLKHKKEVPLAGDSEQAEDI